jgi:hypothetical protein
MHWLHPLVMTVRQTPPLYSQHQQTPAPIKIIVDPSNFTTIWQHVTKVWELCNHARHGQDLSSCQDSYPFQILYKSSALYNL